MTTQTFIISFIILLFVCCSSKKQKFKIDSSVSPRIDSIFNADESIDSSSRSIFSFHIKRTFDFERFGQHDRDLAYFLKKEKYKSKEVYISCRPEGFLDKDTIDLTAVIINEGGIGFLISIFDDKFDSKFRLIATSKIYSKTEEKKDLRDDIILNADSISLTLTEKPTYKTGSRLKGKMEVKYESFYQLDSSDKLSKIEPRFNIIFDTEVN
jgi:hypothetical protein